jgi:hypothetical protein
MSNAVFASPPGALRLRLQPPRIEWPARPDPTTLLAGRAAPYAAAVLPRLYPLCGQAHGLAARLALQAAQSGDCTADAAQQRALVLETVREHARAILIDWPAQLQSMQAGDAEPHRRALAACPLFRGTSGRDETLRWLHDHVYGEDPSRWQAHCTHDAEVSQWCAQASTLPARWLGAALDRARECARVAPPALPSVPDRGFLAELASAALVSAAPPPAAFETGCWQRHLNSPRHAADRLWARLRDLAWLADGEAASLRAFGHASEPGVGLAWVEMARGVLIHVARLDRARARIVAYRSLAPTDWNFAPGGPVAQALAAAADDCAARVIGAAFTPCLPFEVEPSAAARCTS